MNTRTVLLSLFVGLALVFALALAALSTWTRAGREPLPMAAGPAAAGESGARAPGAPLATSQGRRAAQDEGRARAGGARLRGRVVSPAGAPADHEIEVYAVAGATSYPNLVAELLAAERAGREAPVLARGTAGADGSFELALPDARQEAFLHARGRFLHSTEAVRASAGEPARLPLVAGGHVEVALRTPDGEAAGEARVVLRTEVRDFGGVDGPAPLFLNWSLPVGEDGRARARAVPRGAAHVVRVESPGWPAVRGMLEPLAAFEERKLELRLTRGGAAAGKVVDETGAPVAGARVAAFVAGRYFGFDDEEVREARADGEGRFRLTALPVGDLKLRASKDGYLESGKLAIEVAEEGVLEGVVLELPAGATIAGVVRWPDGGPAAGVEVEVEFDPAGFGGMGAFNAARGASGEASTDEEGRFLVGGLGRGPFVVEVRAPAPESSEEARRDESTWLRARRTRIAPGTADLELLLEAPRGLHGEVRFLEGEAPASFEVAATQLLETQIGELGIEVRRERFESSAGRFFFAAVEAGPWKLEAVAEGWISARSLRVEMPSTSEEAPAVIELVRAASVAGRVLDPAGAPVRGALVRTHSGNWRDRMERGLEAPRVRSGEDGAFVLEGVAPRALELVAEHEGFARSEPAAFELAPGERREGLELRLRTGGTVTGEVWGAGGDPAAGRMVTVTKPAGTDARTTSSDERGEFRVEHLEPGSWQVVSMGGGADLSSGEGEPDLGAMMQDMAMAAVEVADGETVHVVLGAAPKQPIRVHGRVTLAEEPYAGAMLSFYPAGEGTLERMAITTADGEGRYELTLDGAGDYVISVAKITGAPGQQSTIEYEQEIPAREELRLDLELPLGRISGRVLGPDGETLPGARISLARDGELSSASFFGGQYGELSADEAGSFDLRALRPGSYRISAGGASLFSSGGEHSPGRVTKGGIELDEGEWIEGLEFRLEEPGALEVLVVDAARRPVSEATVFVRDSQGRVADLLAFQQTGGDGKLRHGGLAPGEYSAVARKAGAASAESPRVRVRAGETAPVTVTLDAGVVLVVAFEDAGGKPTRAHVRVLDSEDREVSGLLALQDLQLLYTKGGFSPTEHRVGPLAPGKYTVHARAGDLRESKSVVLRAGDSEKRMTLRFRP